MMSSNRDDACASSSSDKLNYCLDELPAIEGVARHVVSSIRDDTCNVSVSKLYPY